MHLSQATIGKILGTASPHVRRDGVDALFTLVCTVEEGIACRFGSAAWWGEDLGPLATRIVDELGWKAVEHAARRQVVVRCVVPAGDPALTRCECDRGNGFEPIAVTER